MPGPFKSAARLLAASEPPHPPRMPPLFACRPSSATQMNYMFAQKRTQTNHSRQKRGQSRRPFATLASSGRPTQPDSLPRRSAVFFIKTHSHASPGHHSSELTPPKLLEPTPLLTAPSGPLQTAPPLVFTLAASLSRFLHNSCHLMFDQGIWRENHA